MIKKLAIILSGGGMTSVYSAGVVEALVKEHGFSNPDILISASGGAGTATYYLTGQNSKFKPIWTEVLAKKGFANIFRIWKVIDIDYLIDVVFKKLEPLDVAKVVSSKIKYYISAINYQTGMVEYFSDWNNNDIFEAMRASKYIPMVVKGSVLINGQSYGDSGLSSNPGIHILKALELGASHILVIDTKGFNSINGLVCRLWLLFKSRQFKKNYYQQQLRAQNIAIPEQVKLFKIYPLKKPVVGPVTNQPAKLRQTYDQGYQECRDNRDLKDFLNDYLK